MALPQPAVCREGVFDRSVRMNPYAQHDTGGDPNRKVHAIGTVLNLYF